MANFALQIESYGLKITYDGETVDPAELREDRREYGLEAVEERYVALTVIEWNRKIERGLYLCNEGGAALEEIDAGIQAPGFDFTAYVKWDGFSGKPRSCRPSKCNLGRQNGYPTPPGRRSASTSAPA